MPKSNLQNQIKDLFYSEGFDFIGFSSCKILNDFAYLKDWLDQKYNAEMDYMGNHKRQKPVSFLDPSFKSIISCAINYNVLENKINSHNLKKNHGWIARYAMIDDYHKILEKKLKSIAKEIEKFFKNPVRYKVYVDTGPVLERGYAKEAGIGWMGKNSCLINKDLGSWFFLAEILISEEFAYDEPVKDMCGTCTKCIDACPTNAIIEAKVIDSNRCISYLTIENKKVLSKDFVKQVGNNIYGCDICQEVCPWNSKSKIKNNFNWNLRDEFVSPDLENILDLVESDWETMKIKSPVKRAKKNGLIRNILNAMSNSGEKSYKERILKYIDSEDDVLSITAEQALIRLDSDDS